MARATRAVAHVLAPVSSWPSSVMQPAVPDFWVSLPVFGFRSNTEMPYAYWPA